MTFEFLAICAAVLIFIGLCGCAYEMIMIARMDRTVAKNWPSGSSSHTLTPGFFTLKQMQEMAPNTDFSGFKEPFTIGSVECPNCDSSDKIEIQGPDYPGDDTLYTCHDCNYAWWGESK